MFCILYIKDTYIQINKILYFSSYSGKKKKKTEDIIFDDSKLLDPIDNVWIEKDHKLKIYSFEDAVESHRETHHPTIYNSPNALLNAFIELDMQVKRFMHCMSNLVKDFLIWVLVRKSAMCILSERLNYNI